MPEVTNEDARLRTLASDATCVTPTRTLMGKSSQGVYEIQLGQETVQLVDHTNGTIGTYSIPEGFKELVDAQIKRIVDTLVVAMELFPTDKKSPEIIVDPKTGSMKESKLARFDLIPADFLWDFSEVYGRGGQKYPERNWEKGHQWGLFYAALNRHASQAWRGVWRDEETGAVHWAQVAWHAATLYTYMKHNIGTDDRPDFILLEDRNVKRD